MTITKNEITKLINLATLNLILTQVCKFFFSLEKLINSSNVYMKIQISMESEISYIHFNGE